MPSIEENEIAAAYPFFQPPSPDTGTYRDMHVGECLRAIRETDNIYFHVIQKTTKLAFVEPYITSSPLVTNNVVDKKAELALSCVYRMILSWLVLARYVQFSRRPVGTVYLDCWRCYLF